VQYRCLVLPLTYPLNLWLMYLPFSSHFIVTIVSLSQLHRLCTTSVMQTDFVLTEFVSLWEDYKAYSRWLVVHFTILSVSRITDELERIWRKWSWPDHLPEGMIYFRIPSGIWIETLRKSIKTFCWTRWYLADTWRKYFLNWVMCTIPTYSTNAIKLIHEVWVCVLSEVSITF
jgi:hypothetical protein